MTELQGDEDRLEISADSGVFVRSRTEGLHGRSRVGGSAPSLCQRARCYQSRPWDLLEQSDRLELLRATVRCHTAASGSGAGANLLDQIGERAIPACGVRGVLDAHGSFPRAGAFSNRSDL